MGMFDDLIPAQSPAAPSAVRAGMFDDLIPQSGETVALQPGERPLTVGRDRLAGQSGTGAGGPSMGEAFGRGIAQGTTFNFGDELAGVESASGLPDAPNWLGPLGTLYNVGTRAPIGAARMAAEAIAPDTFGHGGGDAYSKTVEAERAANEAAAAAHPIANIAGQVGGGLVTAPLTGFGGGIAGAAKTGALLGGLYGAGGGTDLRSRATGAVGGAAIGGAGGAALGAAVAPFTRPAAPNAVVEAADRLGVSVPNAVASNNRLTQVLGAGIRNVPFAGEPLREGAERTVTQLGRAADRLSAGLGTADRSLAGEGTRADLAYRMGGPTPDMIDAGIRQRFADRASQLGQGVPAGTGRASVGSRIGSEVERYHGQTLKNLNKQNYDAVNSQLSGDKIPLTATKDAISALNKRLTQSGASISPGSDVIGRVVERAKKGNVTYQGIRDLRSAVGEVLAGKRDAEKFDRFIPESLYASLSQDLESHIFAKGDEALYGAWEAANKAFIKGKGEIDQLSRLVTDARTPEAVFDAVARLASSKGGAGVERLALLKKAMSPEAWNDLASTMLRGFADKGPDTLAKSLRDLSPAGRSMLFADKQKVVDELVQMAPYFESRNTDVPAMAKFMGAEGQYNKAMAAASSRDAEMARFKKIIGISGAATDEQIYDRVIRLSAEKSGAGIKDLAAIKSSVSPDTWKTITATAIQRLGRDAEGDFSPLRFLTDYGKISEAGKTLLFKSTGQQDLARALDDIATVSSKFKELQKYANPSGTAHNVSFVTIGAGLVTEPMTTIGSIVGGNFLARMLATPATASSMARWSNAYYAFVKAPTIGTLSGLRLASRNFGSTVADKLGVPAVGDRLFGAIASHATGQDQNAPRPGN